MAGPAWVRERDTSSSEEARIWIWIELWLVEAGVGTEILCLMVLTAAVKKQDLSVSKGPQEKVEGGRPA